MRTYSCSHGGRIMANSPHVKSRQRKDTGQQGFGGDVSFLVAVAGVAITAGGRPSGEQGKGGNDDGRRGGQSYAIGLWGDLPYSDVQALTGVPNLIADMNSQDLEFTVHDGDFKAGNGTPGSVTPTICSNAMYLQGLSYLNALDAPAMFTPGDNDWTDC